MKGLVIVESPAKARTIKRYLGEGYEVVASYGHVRDLPERELGVDVERGFQPRYVVPPKARKVLSQIKKAAKKAPTIYIATDPDREGEAIGWHIAEALSGAGGGRFARITFNEITRRAVQEALANPRDIDERLVSAQQARRVLDRLVGYKVSPLLWPKGARSAGRVQTVALRLVYEREQEIAAFVPQEYWTVDALLACVDGQEMTARVHKVDGEEPRLADEASASAVAARLEGARARVESVERKAVRRRPKPPYTTSTLQQDASSRLGMSASRAMALAQQLYEGVELGPEGPVGLITYMRTDSVRVSEEALTAAAGFIASRFGREYLPERPNRYASGKGAQDAHEAIRPTDPARTPEEVAPYLERDQLRLYELIWRRFLASQMAPAVYERTSVELACAGITLRASGSVLVFPGFLSVYELEEEEDGGRLPPVEEGQELKVVRVVPEQHFTEPPPRYTEGSLIKALEENGVGRPSTYAPTVAVIQERGYVRKDKKRRLHCTEKGALVVRMLTEAFPHIFDVDFTARMEAELDQVEEGRLSWQEVLSDFYGPFSKLLEGAARRMSRVKRGMEEEIGEPCPSCGRPLVRRIGRYGPFAACSGFPECRFSRPLEKPEELPDRACPACGAKLLVRRSAKGVPFISCSRYPECKHAEPLAEDTGLPCPSCGQGRLQRRAGKGGKEFYGCSRYPECRFATARAPAEEPCPACGFPVTFGARKRVCLREGCPNAPRRKAQAGAGRRRAGRAKGGDGQRADDSPGS